MDNIKLTLFDSLPTLGDIDMTVVSERAEAVSAELIESIVATAAEYPAKKPDITEIKGTIADLIEPDTKNPEDSVVGAVAMFNVFQPYMVDRLLELDIYNPSHLREQMSQLRRDAVLAHRFFRSVSHVTEFALTGKTSVTETEAANELFDIGPLFAQLCQSFTARVQDAGGDDEFKQFLARIGTAMQEGVAMPNLEQQQKIAANLPNGLILEDVISSAKIAYVARTRSRDGEVFATKLKRPDGEQALADNARMFTLMTDVITRYVETHADNTPLARRFSIVRKALPVVLAIIETDMQKEMDFEEEASLQKRAIEIFAGHENIIVPAVHDDYSDADHITMDMVSGERIEDVPANPAYVKSALVLFLEGRKEGFLHGDMHPGNIKVAAEAPEGTLVAYDWGKSIDLPPRFERNLIRFLATFIRKKPRAMATAYRRIENPEHHQTSQEEAEGVARVAIDAAHQPADRVTKAKLANIPTVFRNFIFTMIIRQQSMMDSAYATYMRSARSLARDFIGAELAKPAYATRRVKVAVLAKSMAGALKEVHLNNSRR